MFVVGLTGGVGSGKSTVAELFACHGTYLIDADQVAREVVEPGTPGLDAVVARFGDRFLTAESGLNRSALAELVFTDKAALADLNAIIHPLVRSAIAVALAQHAGTNHVVVLSVPLFVESGQYKSDCLIVVDAPRELAISRLMDQRDWSREQVETRMDAQLSAQQRRAVADYVIENDGSLEQLSARVDDAWQWVVERSVERTD